MRIGEKELAFRKREEPPSLAFAGASPCCVSRVLPMERLRLTADPDTAEMYVELIGHTTGCESCRREVANAWT